MFNFFVFLKPYCVVLSAMSIFFSNYINPSELSTLVSELSTVVSLKMYVLSSRFGLPS